MFNVDSIDKDKTKLGSWADFSDGKFLIAHSGNLSFQREFSRLQQPHRKKIDRGNLDPKIANEIMCRAMSSSILLNWKNVGSEGNELAYSEETAYNVLLNNDELREFVQEYSLDLENFRSETIEESGES
jgi:hypothetical protein